MMDSYRDLIDGLIETPTMLREILGQPVPDDASPEVVALLVELRGRESAELRRVQAIMRESQATLRAIEREPELANADEVEADAAPEALLAGFGIDRGELVSLLVNLTLRDWERPLFHDVTGETTLSDELEEHLVWDEGIVDRFRAAAA